MSYYDDYYGDEECGYTIEVIVCCSKEVDGPVSIQDVFEIEILESEEDLIIGVSSFAESHSWVVFLSENIGEVFQFKIQSGRFFYGIAIEIEEESILSVVEGYIEALALMAVRNYQLQDFLAEQEEDDESK